MYRTGEKPSKGTYVCIKCGTVVVLDDGTDTLPSLVQNVIIQHFVNYHNTN